MSVDCDGVVATPIGQAYGIVCIAYDVLLLKAVQEAEAAYSVHAGEGGQRGALPIWMLAHPSIAIGGRAAPGFEGRA